MSRFDHETAMLGFAKKTAKAAGELLFKQRRTLLQVEQWDRHDLKLRADQISEALIVHSIKEQYQKDAIVSEEGLAENSNIDRSNYTWVIDPLDGTRNYAAGIPYYGVSIAVLRDLEPVIGVVYVPCTGELFWAVKGKGAYCNHMRLMVSHTDSLQKAKVSVGWGQQQVEQGILAVSNLAHHACFVLVNFAPALDLCNVARGLLDGLIDCGTEPYDHAAGGLILKEAGGMLTNYNGQPWQPLEIGLIGANVELHAVFCNAVH